MPIRQTHTFAVLEISRAAYLEIRNLLEQSGYQHCFMQSRGRPVIDMQGIAIAEPEISPEPDAETVVEFNRRVRRPYRIPT